MNPLRLLRNLLHPEEPWDYRVLEAEWPACPWRCPDCNGEMTQYVHDGWECLECGSVD